MFKKERLIINKNKTEKYYICRTGDESWKNINTWALCLTQKKILNVVKDLRYIHIRPLEQFLTPSTEMKQYDEEFLLLLLLLLLLMSFTLAII